MNDFPAAGRIISSHAEESIPLDIEFPLRKVFFPLGFPLEVHTNSAAVMSAAAASWGAYASRFSKPPLELRIGVIDQDCHFVNEKPAPVHRIQRNLLSIILDAHNFVVSDLSAGFSFGWATDNLSNATSYLRYHLLEGPVLCMISALHATALHAACVAPGSHGMLLCGDSGAGKSSLAFAGARAGWTFVSDDASYLPFDRDDRTVVGNCHQFRLRDASVLLFPELKGRPITSRPSGKPSIEISTEELPNVRVAQSATVQSIILLNRRHNGKPDMVPLSKEKALSVMGKNPVPAAPESRTAHERAVHHLVDAQVFELRYTNIDWAVTRLERLAATGE